MVDDKRSGGGEPDEEILDDATLDPAEREAAAALARMLDEKRPAAPVSAAPDPRDALDPLDREAVGVLRASLGQAAPLGELKARSLAKAAVESAKRREATRAQRRWRQVAWVGAAAAALVIFIAGGRLVRPAPPLPEELCSRSAGMLVPGPFPSTQGAAERLDVVTEDRLVALREVHLRALGGGRR